MAGIWPVLDRFPAYGTSQPTTAVRAYSGEQFGSPLAAAQHRVEQNHAEYWLNWAEGANIPCEEILHWVPLHGTQILANWCEDVSRKDTLAAGIATTNYAVESATGEWSPLICESKSFTGRFPARITAGSLRGCNFMQDMATPILGRG